MQNEALFIHLQVFIFILVLHYMDFSDPSGVFGWYLQSIVHASKYFYKYRVHLSQAGGGLLAIRYVNGVQLFPSIRKTKSEIRQCIATERPLTQKGKGWRFCSPRLGVLGIHEEAGSVTCGVSRTWIVGRIHQANCILSCELPQNICVIEVPANYNRPIFLLYAFLIIRVLFSDAIGKQIFLDRKTDRKTDKTRSVWTLDSHSKINYQPTTLEPGSYKNHTLNNVLLKITKTVLNIKYHRLFARNCVKNVAGNEISKIIKDFYDKQGPPMKRDD